MDNILEKLYFYKNLYELEIYINKQIFELSSKCCFKDPIEQVNDELYALRTKKTGIEKEIDCTKKLLKKQNKPSALLANFFETVVTIFSDYFLVLLFLIVVLICFFIATITNNGKWISIERIGFFVTLDIFLAVVLVAIIKNLSANKIPTKKEELNNQLSELTESLESINKQIDKKEHLIKYPTKQIKRHQETRNAFLKTISIEKKQLEIIKNTIAIVSESQKDIYNKYFEFIPICTFIEYLESKRCSKLDGPDGCYNLYELEKRIGIIIDNLAQVNATLHHIDNKMNFVCSEFYTINKSIQNFSYQLDCLAKGDNQQRQLSQSINNNLKYIKACETFLIAGCLPSNTRELTLMKAFADLHY